MIKRILYGIIAIVIIGFGAFYIYAWHPAIPAQTAEQIAQTRQTFTPEMIERGKVLAAAGYCATCHTSANGKSYAGNYQMNTAFGTIYSSNLTPDVETGIGAWSEEAFARAMRQGVDREGKHLLPALPYEHFNKMTDEDINAIYAYIMTDIQPVNEAKKENGIPFPLNIRLFQAGWKLLFADNTPFKPNQDKSELWNRGAYLAEGISHCGACHTPRNMLGGEEYKHMYEGADIDGWVAPPITPKSPGVVGWSTADFYEYLTTGNSPYHGSAVGPMGPVVHAGLKALSDQDLQAISTYFGDINGNVKHDPDNNPKLTEALEKQQPESNLMLDQGGKIYAAACASCHYNPQSGVVKGRPLLTIDAATRLDKPTNLVNVILDGVRADQGISGVVMPGFRNNLTDDQIAALSVYLRSQTGLPAWKNVTEQVKELRAQPPFEH